MFQYRILSTFWFYVLFVLEKKIKKDKHCAFPQFISKEGINHLPLCRYTGEIHIINEEGQLPGVLQLLEEEYVLGFDTESRPAFQKGVSYGPSLLQLASSKAVYLFQLSLMGGLDPLIDLLSRKIPLKVGVAISEDLQKLLSMRKFEPQGFLELTHMSQQFAIENKSLRALSAIILGKRISKGAQVSNWANINLTNQQINYAATDAWICRELYIAMKQLKSSPK